MKKAPQNETHAAHLHRGLVWKRTAGVSFQGKQQYGAFPTLLPALQVNPPSLPQFKRIWGFGCASRAFGKEVQGFVPGQATKPEDVSPPLLKAVWALLRQGLLEAGTKLCGRGGRGPGPHGDSPQRLEVRSAGASQPCAAVWPGVAGGLGLPGYPGVLPRELCGVPAAGDRATSKP